MAGVLGPAISAGTTLSSLSHAAPRLAHSPGLPVAVPLDPDDLVAPHLVAPHLVINSLKIAVCLLFCNDNPRVTSFTRVGAERALDVTKEYLWTQSGGRQTLDVTVFDWVELPVDANEWVTRSSQGIDAVRPMIEDKIGSSLADFAHILIGIDVPGAGGGTTPGAYTFLAAQNFTPSFIAHELGHRFGADDAYRETPDGPVIYQNQFCVMGATGWPAIFDHPDLQDADTAGLAGTGPGMSAPTLMATGWLNANEPNICLDLSSANVFMSGGRVEELSRLVGGHRAWSGPPLAIRYFDMLIEYRIGTPDSWDRGLPDPGPNAVGHVVAHRSPVGSPRATFIASMGAVPGASMALGNDNPLDIGHPGPLVVSVLALDPANFRVRIVLTRRPARVIIDLPSLIPDPSKIDDGLPSFIVSPADPGTMVWTREGGLRPLAKGSPAEEVVRAVAQVQALHDLSRVASDDEAEAIAGRTAEAVDALTQAVRAVSVEPPRSSFSVALERLAALERTQAEVGRRSQIPELVQVLEQSRNDLSAVRELLTDAIRQEGEGNR
jgi:hypothetical protein